MATIFRKVYTRDLPDKAELFERDDESLAQWNDAQGKRIVAKATRGQDGAIKVLVPSPCYYVQYRDGSGRRVVKSTGCRTRQAAMAVLNEWTARAEKVKAGIISCAEDAVANHADTPLGQHFDDYLGHMASRGITEQHRKNTKAYLARIARDCSFRLLNDLDRTEFEKWLAAKIRDGVSARTRNAHRTALVAFCNWCLESRRLVANPFARLPKANEKADCRRQRRALTEEEMLRLLEATRRRPLLEKMTVRRGKNKGQTLGKVSDQTKNELEWTGRQRALIYRTMLMTGLRKNELASLTIGQLDLGGPHPCAVLHAAHEKNRQGNTIPLRTDLAAELREWLTDKLAWIQKQALKQGRPAPTQLPLDTPLFDVPTGLIRIFDRDLELAGIAKRDDRGRTVDVHALRHTFGTMLSRAGVAPRVAQAAMRHSTIDLTMNVYTDPRLLDVSGAVEALPGLVTDTRVQVNSATHP
jgi:integrase